MVSKEFKESKISQDKMITTTSILQATQRIREMNANQEIDLSHTLVVALSGMTKNQFLDQIELIQEDVKSSIDQNLQLFDDYSKLFENQSLKLRNQ